MAAQEPAPAPGEDLSLALALINTRVSGTRGVFDRLGDDAELDAWLRRRGLPEARGARGEERADVLRLRDDARAVLAAVEARRAPDASILDRVNTAAAAAAVRPVLRTTRASLALDWETVAPEGPASRIARDLVAFAASPAAARVRTCAADDCDRLFVQDHGRRIWCSAGCGNRMRVKRHASRLRSVRA